MVGWVRLHRSIEDWCWAQDLAAFRIFLYLIMRANHQEKAWKNLVIQRGQLVTSRAHLSAATGISEQRVRTTLANLQSTNDIEVKSTKRYTIITICNYERYQSREDNQQPTINQQKRRKSTNNQPTDNQQITTTKELKNDKNDKKEEEDQDRAREAHALTVTPSAQPPAELIKVPNCPSIQLTKEQAQQVRAKFAEHGLGKPEIIAACEALENYAQNGNAKKFRTYKDHARVLCNWPLRDILKNRPKSPADPGRRLSFEEQDELRRNQEFEIAKANFLKRRGVTQ